MRRKYSKLRMGLRGRSGFVTYLLFGTAILVAFYYAWNHLYPSKSKINYSSVQGVKRWTGQKMHRFDVNQSPLEMNKEIEMQMADEKWKKQKALQDRIDEERLLEEKSAARQLSLQQAAEAARKEQLGLQLVAGGKPAEAPMTEDQDQTEDPLTRKVDAAGKEYFSKLERLVHLDLKGAPPLVSYLLQVFPLFKKLGATGLLMEYEDMFPFYDSLSVLAAGNAYSMSDLRRIQDAAVENGLEIIPLVQTFGHMEFVLKYPQFQHLRESEFTPQVITPVKEESYSLLYSIIKQVLQAHPKARRIHLGCDEVYELGKGQSSHLISSQNTTRSQMFLKHVVKVASFVKNFQVQPLIWDDLLRSMSYEVLWGSGLQRMVEPVVWYYRNNILDRVPAERWEIYGKLFPGVWVASAFKGATGSAQIATQASVHLENNLRWVDVVRQFGMQKKQVRFRGTILTGWQRFDHFAVLCELLPVGLPSLAINLQAVRSGGFESAQRLYATQMLGCPSLLDLNFPELDRQGKLLGVQDCTFPGSPVFSGVQHLWALQEGLKRKNVYERISGWMSDYHVRLGITNPGQMRILILTLNKTIDTLQGMIEPFQKNLIKVFDQYTVKEWIGVNLQDQISYFSKALEKAKKLMERKSWPRRPFPESVPTPQGAETRANQLQQVVQSSRNQNANPRQFGAGPAGVPRDASRVARNDIFQNRGPIRNVGDLLQNSGRIEKVVTPQQNQGQFGNGGNVMSQIKPGDGALRNSGRGVKTGPGAQQRGSLVNPEGSPYLRNAQQNPLHESLQQAQLKPFRNLGQNPVNGPAMKSAGMEKEVAKPYAGMMVKDAKQEKPHNALGLFQQGLGHSGKGLPQNVKGGQMPIPNQDSLADHNPVNGLKLLQPDLLQKHQEMHVKMPQKDFQQRPFEAKNGAEDVKLGAEAIKQNLLNFVARKGLDKPQDRPLQDQNAMLKEQLDVERNYHNVRKEKKRVEEDSYLDSFMNRGDREKRIDAF